MVLVSILAGLAAPPLAALPAIRRGLRVDLREALEASGSALGSQGATDRALRRVAFLPPAVQLGLRNAGRRKRRSLATAAIVALAVANLLATLALARAATEGTRTSWGDHLEDVQVSTAGALFNERAASVLRTTPGVAEAEPVLKNTVELDGREAFAWGVEREPLLRYRLTAGRWFSAAEDRARERVAVIERNIAQLAGARARRGWLPAPAREPRLPRRREAERRPGSTCRRRPPQPTLQRGRRPTTPPCWAHGATS